MSTVIFKHIFPCSWPLACTLRNSTTTETVGKVPQTKTTTIRGRRCHGDPGSTSRPCRIPRPNSRSSVATSRGADQKRGDSPFLLTIRCPLFASSYICDVTSWRFSHSDVITNKPPSFFTFSLFHCCSFDFSLGVF